MIPRRDTLRRRIRIVVALTIGYNLIEAVIALVAGNIASSAALIGFGLDSVVEVLSAAAVAWQFAAPDPEKREWVALRVIAASFFALAIYVSVDAILSIIGLREPESSPVGIVLAAVSLVVMPFLSWIERKVEVGNICSSTAPMVRKVGKATGEHSTAVQAEFMTARQPRMSGPLRGAVDAAAAGDRPTPQDEDVSEAKHVLRSRTRAIF